MSDRRLFLLDAYALIFRAYYALIKMPRMTRDGSNVSAIFGFVNTLEELLRKERPSHMAVCFDPAGPTFRDEAFAEYKGERAPTPEDIKRSVPIIKEICRAYRIPVIEVAGFEADDVIGTLAKRAEGEGYTTYMMTPDKDYAQLVSDTILQYKPAYRGQDFELRGVAEVCERFGIERPEQVIDILALMGDKVDNIPGCPGIGDKTAAKLIQQFGSVENLIDSTDQLKGAQKTKIETNAEQIRFSKFLATIRTDVPVEESIDSLEALTPDTDKLFAIFRSLEFKTLIDRVSRRLGIGAGGEATSSAKDTAPSAATAASATPAVGESVAEEVRPEPQHLSDLKYHTSYVEDTHALEAMQSMLLASEECGVCVYTEGENDMTCSLQGIAIAVSENGKKPSWRGWWIPASYAEGVAAALDLMARPDIRKVTLNAKRDMVMSWRLRHRQDPALSDMDVPKGLTNWSDVTLAHYILQPDMRHDIDNVALQYLNYAMSPAADAGKARKSGTIDFDFGGDEEMMRTATERALTILRLRPVLEEAVERVEGTALLHDLEFPLAAVLAKMEVTGVRIDVKTLNTAAQRMDQELQEIEASIFEETGETFNVGSPAQVGEILFGKMQLDPKAKRTKSGQYSTSEEVLEKVAHKSPVVRMILQYRQLKKLLNTYLTALPAAINPATGRIHTVYNQSVTATGRLSSSNPNLQNIPVRDEMGREIREAFIPSEGWLFLSADYSQIELRLVADFADDPIMLEAFRTGADIHAITAAKIHHKELEEVTADERRGAKTANFGILYGISAFGLASRLGIPRADAKALIDGYFATFPTIHKYMADSVERARETGYAVTPAGRRRYLADINSKNPVVRGYSERNAINAPIQGAAADIIKRAMIDIDAEMSRRGMQSRMIMQVHDELNFDVHPAELADLQEIVTRCMTAAYSGRVVLETESGVGANWLQAH